MNTIIIVLAACERSAAPGGRQAQRKLEHIMGEEGDWLQLDAEITITEQPRSDRTHELMEIQRRKQMFLKGNYHSSSKFSLGDVVEDDVFGESVVVGLPGRNAAPPAPGRVGACGTTWVKSGDGALRWRSNEHLRQLGQPNTPKRSSPRLEQAALKRQRARNRDDELSDADDRSDDDATDNERDMPALSKHERNRKIMKKPKTKSGIFKTVAVSTKETSVPLEQRLKEFPEQGLVISVGKLWCSACKKSLPNLKTTIETHVGCKKHKDKYAKFIIRNDADSKLGDNILEYFQAHPDERGVCDDPRPSAADQHAPLYILSH